VELKTWNVTLQWLSWGKKAHFEKNVLLLFIFDNISKS